MSVRSALAALLSTLAWASCQAVPPRPFVVAVELPSPVASAAPSFAPAPLPVDGTLDRFERRYVSTTDALAASELALELPRFLEGLYPMRTDRVRTLARRLHDGRYSIASAGAVLDDPRFPRRVFELGLIAGGFDVPMTDTWRQVASRWICRGASAGGLEVLQVTRDCSCGEPLACRARFSGAAIELEVRFDPKAPLACDDCFAVASACKLPELPAGGDWPILENGAATGLRIRTDPEARPSGIPCH